MSCSIDAFDEVFPKIERKARPTEWEDGSQELTKITWVAVAILSILYALPKLYTISTANKDHNE